MIMFPRPAERDPLQRAMYPRPPTDLLQRAARLLSLHTPAAGLRIFLFLCLTCIPSAVGAQPSPANVPVDRLFHRIQTIDGLLHNTVVGITQDVHGYVWIAGGSRLLRYDGYGSQCFSNAIADSLLQRWSYTGLTGGSHGTLCLYGATDEVALYDVDSSLARLIRLLPPGGPAAQPVHTSFALEDSRGRFWVATREGAVYQIAPPSGGTRGTALPLTLPPWAGGDPVLSLVEASDGTIWAGGRRGMIPLAGGSESSSGDAPAPAGGLWHPPDSIVALQRRNDGGVWVARASGEIGVFDPLARKYQPLGSVFRPRLRGPVRALAEDRQGNLWVAAGSFGLDLLARGERHLRTYLCDADPNPRTTTSVKCLFVDRSGLLWIGTWAQGLLTYAPWRLKFHSRTPAGADLATLNGAFVTSALEDGEGTLWVGTMGDGLYRLAPGSREFRHLLPRRGESGSISSYAVICLCQRRNGELWVGTVEGGLSVLRPGASGFIRRTHSARDPGSLGADTVNALFEDADGTVWVGHVRGVDTYRDRTGAFSPFLRWPAESVARTGTASYFYRDRRQRLWIATAGRGLLRLGPSPGDSVWYRRRPGVPGSLPSDAVDCVTEDRDGRIWLGIPAGLALFDSLSGAFTTYPVRSSTRHLSRPSRRERFYPPGVGVAGISADLHGNLWLSTTHGLARFAVATGACHLFGDADGVPFREGMRHALARGRDGRIYCGGRGGIVTFHPDSLERNTTPPPIVITQFHIPGIDSAVTVSPPREVLLPHTLNTFSITFAALDYTDPGRNLYSFMLEGADPAWGETQTGRSVTYANVEPGHYLFRVRGCNSDGVWNEAGIALPIEIDPPVWQRLWFRGILLVLALAIAYGGYRYRLAKVLALERLRLRIANDLHDDIGSDLSGLALESDLLACRMPEGDPGRERLRSVGGALRRSAENLRDVVWIVSPDRDRFDDLIERMREVASKMLEDLPWEFRSAGTPPAEALDLEFKRHVLMTFKEMLHNIISHARATKVEIELEIQEGRFRLCVRDDGVGFDTGATHTGRGLRSLQARASALGGALTIESAPGKGTVVCLQADIARL